MQQSREPTKVVPRSRNSAQLLPDAPVVDPGNVLRELGGGILPVLSSVFLRYLAKIALQAHHAIAMTTSISMSTMAMITFLPPMLLHFCADVRGGELLIDLSPGPKFLIVGSPAVMRSNSSAVL